MIIKIAKGTFEKEDNIDSTAFFDIKFLIVLDQLVGFSHFQEQDFRKI